MMSNKILAEKNLSLSLATLSISEIARNVSDMNLSINAANLVRMLQTQGMFVKYPDMNIIIRIQKREKGYSIAVLPPKTSDLIKKMQVGGKIDISNIVDIAKSKSMHMNTQRIDSNIKTIIQTANQLKIEVIYQ